ncbi:MAG: exo-alpha-sialidase [Gemmatimonadetes bacterium]|jgi:hypothetical protein|nr:exo-alpha-sialidase [Gemmatimonadota bacterium]
MQLKNVEHITVAGGPNLVCHWPRQGGIWRWEEEILVAYIESPCGYGHLREVGHGQEGIWKRGYVRLRRSHDGGKVWADAGKFFDNSLPVEEQRRVLRLDDYRMDESGRHLGPPRREIDMRSRDAILLMGRSWCGEETEGGAGHIVRDNVAYCFRSPDRGENWEEVPSIIWPDNTRTVVELANNYLKAENGRLFCWMVGCGGIEGVATPGGRTYSPQLYASDDQGENWEFYSEIYCDADNRIAASYPHIVVLPSGRWVCFLGCWHQAAGARIRWTSMCVSDDRGLNWSAPRRIQEWSVSPFPLLLKDGRLMVVYMRRSPDPTGLYAIISRDQGEAWSAPQCLRDDTLDAGPRGFVDGGYPVAVQLDDGQILVVYYWQLDDAGVPWHGGRRFIGGTYFDVE